MRLCVCWACCHLDATTMLVARDPCFEAGEPAPARPGLRRPQLSSDATLALITCLTDRIGWLFRQAEGPVDDQPIPLVSFESPRHLWKTIRTLDAGGAECVQCRMLSLDAPSDSAVEEEVLAAARAGGPDDVCTGAVTCRFLDDETM